MKKNYLLFILFFSSYSLLFGNLQSQIIAEYTNDYSDEYGTANVNGVLGNLGSSSKYVSVPNSSSFNKDTTGTIEMWVYPANINHENTLIAKGNSLSSLSFSLNVSAVDGLFFRIGSTSFVPSVHVNLNTNIWSHVAVSWTGGPDSFSVNYFLNGVLISTVGPVQAVWNINNDSLIIGMNKAVQQNYFEGKIDEVRIWNSARTVSQIAQNRFTGLGDGTNANLNNTLTSNVQYSGLISSWTFNKTDRAYDDISNLHGDYIGGASSQPELAGQPIPYNFALKLLGLSNDFVTIPDNPVFYQPNGGTFESWIYLFSSGGTAPVFTKGGPTYAETSLAVFITPAGKLGLNIGAHNYISSGPTTLSTFKWYHISATWSNGPPFTVNLYVNGHLEHTETHTALMPVNTYPAWIGKNYTLTHRFSGMIDEVRLWNVVHSQNEIQNNMFVSGKVLRLDTNLIGLWNFDGNLKNLSATSGLDGSFSNGAANNARLSAYYNEVDPGPYNSSFETNNTVLNGSGLKEFIMSYPNKICSDTGDTKDSIYISDIPGNAVNLQVWVSLQHARTGDLSLILTAPNGQSKVLSMNNGGNSKNGYFTIFDDAVNESVTSSLFLSPWTNYVKPQNTMGSFGNTIANGFWVLKINDAVPLNQALLLGWGLKINNSVSINPISNEIPDDYSLKQNYPNPFNPVTTIEFSLPKAGRVSVKIFDISGKEYSTNITNSNLNAGMYKLDFNGSDLSSGIYFYSLIVNEITVKTKKMMLIK